jgi:hypothetical protein
VSPDSSKSTPYNRIPGVNRQEMDRKQTRIQSCAGGPTTNASVHAPWVNCNRAIHKSSAPHQAALLLGERTLVLPSSRTGLRMSELFAFKWRDINLLSNEITLRDQLCSSRSADIKALPRPAGAGTSTSRHVYRKPDSTRTTAVDEAAAETRLRDIYGAAETHLRPKLSRSSDLQPTVSHI